MAIKPDDIGQLEKFDNINPALAALDPGDPGLILPHSLGDVLLAQFGVLPFADQEPDQRAMMLSSDGSHSLG